MKLATLRRGGRDGRLVIVSRDLTRCVLVPGIALLWCGVLVDALHEDMFRHAVAMALGGSMIATAHLLNLRFSHAHVKSCEC